MQIGTTQSQVHIAASVSVSSSRRAPENTAPRNGAASGDRLELNTKIDAKFASTVLKDALKSRLEEAVETAGLDISVGEMLSSGQDASPQATAQRIVDFSTGFFEQHAAQNEGQDATAQLEKFVSLIKGAAEAGFADAKGILAGLGEISPEVQAGIDETSELVAKGIDEFAEEKLQILDRAAAGEAQEVGAL
jgi:hypothetical protein